MPKTSDIACNIERQQHCGDAHQVADLAGQTRKIVCQWK